MKFFGSETEQEVRVKRTIMFADIVGSTALKETADENAWMGAFEGFYEVVTDTVAEGGAGTIVKYLGDGVMVAYDHGQSAAALRDAIRIQERLRKAEAKGRRVTVYSSIGIASGEVLEFKTPSGISDYLGPIVDRAERLCAVASAQAIFLDRTTQMLTPMHDVSSAYGLVDSRTPEEYLGDVEKVNVKGFKEPIAYHEILWEHQLFGVKSRAMTAAATGPPRETEVQARQMPVRAPDAEKQRPRRGVVKTWDSEKGRGFFSTAEGVDFYSDSRFVAGGIILRPNQVVYFAASDPLTPGKHPLATAVVAVGESAEGWVVGLKEGAFAFIQVSDQRGHHQDIYAACGELDTQIRRGEIVTFTVDETPLGARATSVRRINSREAEAA